MNRRHPVAGEPVFAVVEADSTAECVARDADIGAEPYRVARPSSDAFGRSSPQSTPAPTRALPASASICTPPSPSVRNSTVLASEPSGSALCPVRCAATRFPLAAADRTQHCRIVYEAAQYRPAAGRPECKLARDVPVSILSGQKCCGHICSLPGENDVAGLYFVSANQTFTNASAGQSRSDVRFDVDASLFTLFGRNRRRSVGQRIDSAT